MERAESRSRGADNAGKQYREMVGLLFILLVDESYYLIGTLQIITA